jgi:hypothetical protein
MRLQTFVLAGGMLLVPAAFDASFAQSAAVSEKTFDWIFFAIVFIPFLLALIQLFVPDWLEPLVRERRADVEAPAKPLSERA